MNHKATALLLQAILAMGLPSAAAAAHDARLCAAPGGARGCFPTIQAAIDAAPMGATIDVYPGQYTETAPGRFVQGGGGPHQFGLFISQFKSGLTIQGVDDKGNRIHDYRRVQAFITTGAWQDHSLLAELRACVLEALAEVYLSEPRDSQPSTPDIEESSQDRRYLKPPTA